MDFIKACVNVGIEPTKRQNKKFEKRRGLAYRVSIMAKQKLKGANPQLRNMQAKTISNNLGRLHNINKNQKESCK